MIFNLQRRVPPAYVFISLAWQIPGCYTTPHKPAFHPRSIAIKVSLWKAFTLYQPCSMRSDSTKSVGIWHYQDDFYVLCSHGCNKHPRACNVLCRFLLDLRDSVWAACLKALTWYMYWHTLLCAPLLTTRRRSHVTSHDLCC